MEQQRSIPPPRIPTLYDALTLTERRRRHSAWNVRNHPDTTVVKSETAIASFLTDGVTDLIRKGKEAGVDLKKIPVEGLVFPGPSEPLLTPNQTVPLEQEETKIVSPSIRNLLRMSEEEALASIHSSSIMLRYVLTKRNISQQELSNNLARSKSWVDKVGNGSRPLDLRGAFEICDALELPEGHPYRIVLIKLVIEETRNEAIESLAKRRTEEGIPDGEK